MKPDKDRILFHINGTLKALGMVKKNIQNGGDIKDNLFWVEWFTDVLKQVINEEIEKGGMR